DGHAAGDDRAGRTIALYYRCRAQTVSADERELWTDRAAHGAFTRQGEKGNDVASGARRSQRMGARKRRGAGRDGAGSGRAAMSPRRSAFIDIGTNTILCLIAEIRDTGRFRVLDDLAEI